MAKLKFIQKCGIVLTMLLGCSMLYSQELREQPHHPGETIKFEIKLMDLMLRKQKASSDN